MPGIGKPPPIDYHHRMSDGEGAKLTEARNRLRELSLQMPEAHEVEAWGDPTYRVRNKIFSLEKGSGTEVWFKAGPGVQEAVIAANRQVFFVPPYVGHKGWIGARLAAIEDWDEIAELIEDSYRLVAPKRLSAQLDS